MGPDQKSCAKKRVGCHLGCSPSDVFNVLPADYQPVSIETVGAIRETMWQKRNTTVIAVKVSHTHTHANIHVCIHTHTHKTHTQYRGVSSSSFPATEPMNDSSTQPPQRDSLLSVLYCESGTVES